MILSPKEALSPFLVLKTRKHSYNSEKPKVMVQFCSLLPVFYRCLGLQTNEKKRGGGWGEVKISWAKCLGLLK